MPSSYHGYTCMENIRILSYCALVLGIGILFYGTYNYGYRTCQTQYENRLLTLKSENQDKIRYLESLLRENQDKLITEHINEIARLEEKYKDELLKVTTDNLSDTTTCLQHTNTSNTTVSRETKAKSNLKCYTESDLLRKIRESMAIARECDELASKYNTLLEVCK